MSPGPLEALQAVRARIDAACARAGRAPESVGLIAVSKAHSAERVREVQAAGQRLFGENRVQEALAKIPAVGGDAVWHLIGPLQRNKARHAVGNFELIHTVDNEKLGVELDRRAAATGIRQPILIQLNLSNEPTKSGASEQELPRLVETIALLDHLELRGLMTIPPPVERSEQSRPWFSKLESLRSRIAGKFGIGLPELSMGMTDDFEVAIEEGATLVRVGRAIFGERG